MKLSRRQFVLASTLTQRISCGMVDVPSMDDFRALEARVAALEAANDVDPPPIIEQPGVQAVRIADVVERFGLNTFSSLDPNANLWGSWPADYSPPMVIAALKYLTNSSGFQLGLREYHYAGREDMQREWLTQVKAAFPEARVTMCVGANGATSDVPTLLGLADLLNYVEGLNEPNTDFGSGQVPVETTLAIQQAIYAAGRRRGPLTVMGPSVVDGMPNPAGWVTGYFGEHMAAINVALEYGNA
jgi:hypothetical protein